jgi:hypothetical protein
MLTPKFKVALDGAALTGVEGALPQIRIDSRIINADIAQTQILGETRWRWKSKKSLNRC